MIVLTSINCTPKSLAAGDEFCLLVKDSTGCEVMVTEEVTVNKTIDFVAAFRFALEDGTCPGFHLTGIFGCIHELPKEILLGKLLEELTDEQAAKFAQTCGVKTVGQTGKHGANLQRFLDWRQTASPD